MSNGFDERGFGVPVVSRNRHRERECDVCPADKPNAPGVYVVALLSLEASNHVGNHESHQAASGR